MINFGKGYYFIICTLRRDEIINVKNICVPAVMLFNLSYYNIYDLEQLLSCFSNITLSAYFGVSIST